ncbi:MAG: AAA family ATPase [Candidatus Omnitrophica bacterium]|nr:AAA family ATPase [Candidatus Omnitrophota bacterium]
MGKIIALCNQKGGVGKTTSAINISAYFALMKKRTLLIDADPQANATSGLGLDKKSAQKGTYELLMGLASDQEVLVRGPLSNLDVIQSSVALVGAEIELVGMTSREFKLRDKLQRLREEYDYIFIDCPPSLGLLTLNCLVAADSVIIPLQCEYYALEGLSQLMDTVGLVKQALNSKLYLEGVILTMADFRTRLTGEVIKEVQGFFKDRVYKTIIPRSIRLSEAPGFGKPIMLYDKLSVGAQRYKVLAKEILSKQAHLEAKTDKAVIVDELALENENIGLETQLHRALTQAEFTEQDIDQASVGNAEDQL